MTKSKLDNSTRLIDIEQLERRFGFIKNEIITENIAIKMQHISFLRSLESSYELPGTITYSVFQTIIVYTASILECLIHYKLDELIRSGRIQEENIMGKEIQYVNSKEIYVISNVEKICGAKRILKAKRLSDNTNLNDLNRAAKRSGLFTNELFGQAEKIRKMRNRIHTYGLKEVDDKYSKKDIDGLFGISKQIIDRIESY
ncbi:MAG: hypothetical protein AAB373_00450 [Patescibacteria group bacterium]